MGNSTINKIEKSIILSFIFFIFFLTNLNCHGQGVAINTTGNEADTKALLDISAAGMSSTKGGLLIPRITSAERDAITATPPNPESLVIFNTTTNCFEAYYGSVWQSISCLCSNSPAAAGTISGTATVCPGQIAVLYSVPAIARATSYLWSYSGTGAVIVGTTNTAIVYYSASATSGNLTVMATNACGNGTVSADYPVAVNSTAPNITGQPASPAAICLGTTNPTFTVTATGGMAYQWQEFVSSWNNVANAGVYSNVTTATLTITNPPLSMNGYKYRCIVSGTCTNTTTDGLATLTINPIPSVTNANTAIICSGTSPNITLTSSVPSNFTWTIGTVTGSITGASSSSGASINQTLTNPSNATAGSVEYIVTPTSTTGSCVGAAFTITVTVNPTPTVTNTPLTQSICTGGNTTLVSLTSNVSGTTFAWTASATAGITGYTAIGTNTIPVQTISNSGSTAGTVTYAITPTANTCSGAASNYEITINPLPATPTATAGTGVTSHQITANWNAATGATSYALDLSTDNSFTTGFIINNQNVSNILSYNVTSLTAGTTYYYRVRAVNSCGTGGNSNTISSTTLNIASNLVAYWKLDEASGNAASSVGGYTLTNNNTVGYATGKLNNGADFGTSNTTKSFTIPSGLTDLNSNTAFSFSFWIKTSVTSTQFISSRCNGSYSAQWNMYMTAGTILFEISPDNSSSNRMGVKNSTGNAVNNGSWHHVVITYNGSRLTSGVNIYIDGSSTTVINDSPNTLGSNAATGSPGYLGTRTLSNGNMDGMLDEFGIWSRALSSAEASSLYNSGNGIQYPF